MAPLVSEPSSARLGVGCGPGQLTDSSYKTLMSLLMGAGHTSMGGTPHACRQEGPSPTPCPLGGTRGEPQGTEGHLSLLPPPALADSVWPTLPAHMSRWPGSVSWRQAGEGL